MLYIVLILVLAAFGLLIASLVATVTLLAWASLAASVLAAIGLLLDWLLRRRSRRRPAEPAEQAGEDARGDAGTALSERDAEAETEIEGDAEVVPTEPESVGTTVQPQAADGSDVPAHEEEPAEQDTDAADVLVVSESEVQVRVVDERPRYHLARCRWLARRPTLPLPVCEARELGFTPCAVCAPDTEIAAGARKQRTTG